MRFNQWPRWLEALALVVVLLGVLTPACAGQTAAATDPLFTINTVSETTLGQSFAVPINIGTNTPLRSVQFNITFNPALVKVTSVQEGTFFSSWAQAHGASTTVTPGTINNTTGVVTGYEDQLVGAAGQGPMGGDVVAIVNFIVLADGHFYIGIQNYHVIDIYGNDEAAQTYVTGGSVWVGPPPNLSVSSATIQPTGSGLAYGKTFNVSFTVLNTDGQTSITTTVTVGIESPLQSQTFTVPPIGPNDSVNFQATGFTLGSSPTAGQMAWVTVTLLNDGSETVSYTYEPIFSNGTTPVDASVPAYLQITPPAQATFANMQLGSNVISGTLNVQCNTGYEVDLYDNNPTAWHMTEWNGTAFLAPALLSTLVVQAPAQGTSVTAGTAAKLVAGTVQGQSGDAGQNFALTFGQVLHYGDALLTGGETYHLVLTFNGYVTL